MTGLGTFHLVQWKLKCSLEDYMEGDSDGIGSEGAGYNQLIQALKSSWVLLLAPSAWDAY
jgi:hypothetical protein